SLDSERLRLFFASGAWDPRDGPRALFPLPRFQALDEVWYPQPEDVPTGLRGGPDSIVFAAKTSGDVPSRQSASTEPLRGLTSISPPARAGGWWAGAGANSSSGRSKKNPPPPAERAGDGRRLP